MPERVAVVLLWAFCFSGCAASRPLQMSQDTVEHFGRKEFQGARADVFRATLEGLRAIGYGVAQSDAQQGQLRTDRHLFRTEDLPSYSARMWGVPLFGKGTAAQMEREYWLAIAETSPGRVEITANPYLYRDGENVSAEAIWNLETEKRSWQRLFQAIEYELSRLPPTASPFVPRPPGPEGERSPLDAPAPFSPEPFPATPPPGDSPLPASPPPPPSPGGAEPSPSFEDPFSPGPR